MNGFASTFERTHRRYHAAEKEAGRDALESLALKLARQGFAIRKMGQALGDVAVYLRVPVEEQSREAPQNPSSLRLIPEESRLGDFEKSRNAATPPGLSTRCTSAFRS